MTGRIPAPVVAVVADVISENETHATLDSLFLDAGASADPPEGSKHAKALEWMRRVNRDKGSVEPLTVLGRLIEVYMEVVPDPGDWNYSLLCKTKARIASALSAANLQYLRGGRVTVKDVASPSRALRDHIRHRDYESINQEFDRALAAIQASPREAVSAASNILESVCKIYIEEEGIEMPNKRDLRSVWKVVSKSLGMDASKVADRDLKEILSGMGAIVGGVAALRTHASSAHGAGKTTYRVEARHARLAVHSAHTLSLFVLESWSKEKGSGSSS